MHDPRSSTALQQLADLHPCDPGPPRGRWATVRLDAEGRVSLPPDALAALGAASGCGFVARGTCHRVALVLHAAGALAMKVDGRGRLLLPVWLRRRAVASACLLVGAQLDDHLVVIAPTGVLDGLGDMLAGGRR